MALQPFLTPVLHPDRILDNRNVLTKHWQCGRIGGGAGYVTQLRTPLRTTCGGQWYRAAQPSSHKPTAQAGRGRRLVAPKCQPLALTPQAAEVLQLALLLLLHLCKPLTSSSHLLRQASHSAHAQPRPGRSHHPPRPVLVREASSGIDHCTDSDGSLLAIAIWGLSLPSFGPSTAHLCTWPPSRSAMWRGLPGAPPSLSHRLPSCTALIPPACPGICCLVLSTACVLGTRLLRERRSPGTFRRKAALLLQQGTDNKVTRGVQSTWGDVRGAGSQEAAPPPGSCLLTELPAHRR